MKINVRGMVKSPYEFQDTESGEVLRGFKLAYMGGMLSVPLSKETGESDIKKVLPMVGKECDLCADIDIEPSKTAGLFKVRVSNVSAIGVK